ncbi:MAG: hypothetical protein KA152_01705 [Verrucomicrobiales bacterium]|nr:hypothetical protein [Verrucomicrobiales bacterium]
MKLKLTLILLSGLLLTGAGLLSAANAPYPLKVCLVSGEELGTMGKPVVKVYDGKEIKFCCKSCVKKFEANKAKYLAKLK